MDWFQISRIFLPEIAVVADLLLILKMLITHKKYSYVLITILSYIPDHPDLI